MFNRINDTAINRTILEQTPEVNEQPVEDKIAPEAEPLVKASAQYGSGLLAERRLGSFAQELYLRNQLNAQLEMARPQIPIALPVEVPPQPPVTEIPPDNVAPGGGLDVGKGQSGLKTDPASLIPTPLQQYSNGEQVKLLQMELNKWRTNNGMEPLDVTGYFGKKTEEAVKEFQRACNIKDDGIFGPISKHHMILENNQSFQQLPDDDKAAVRQRMVQYDKDPGRREAVVDFATRPDFLNCDSSRARSNTLDYIDLPFDEMPFGGSEKDVKHLEEYLSQRTEMAQDESFQGLSQETKNRIDDEMQGYLWEPVFKFENLKKITTSDSFAKLENEQETILGTLKRMASPGGDTRVNEYQKILDNATGFDNIIKGRILDSAHRNGALDAGIQYLNTMISTDVFKGATPEVQNQMINTFNLLFPGSDIEII